ncbi:hypothetical protein BCR33DRAFT_841309 [Rhizoclosmatium globosum]|uniref:Uncharacterized protein n=1 Tax=Rhizoclosmatium globosum TaxID=329046 RepID=A0A1Y2CSQ6_9FUNG|nr:hypothetical protein BCR33DRAFT_841309 [Rhizoclosmatium globosum]|eukprot:ORY50032.1 hypothetical protein BCR33DRAFT_841309 [Rhizoclosmatium globosum]
MPCPIVNTPQCWGSRGYCGTASPRFRKKTEVVTADASDVDVFSVAVSSLNSAAFRFVLSVSVTPDQRVALFEAADADGAAAVEALVTSATEANAGQCVAALKDLLASDTILCLYLARLRNPVSGRTALMAAVDQCRAVPTALDIVKLLVKLQADLDAQDLDGSSALMLACASPNTRDVALFLLQSTACDVKSFDRLLAQPSTLLLNKDSWIASNSFSQNDCHLLLNPLLLSLLSTR